MDGCAYARLRRPACGRECRCRCSRRRAWRLRRSERERDATGWVRDGGQGPRGPSPPNTGRAIVASRQAGRDAQAERRGARSPALAAAPSSPAARPASQTPAPVRRSKRSGGQPLRLWTAPAGLSRLLLHLFQLRRDSAGLRAEGHILSVMLFELGDRLVWERAPVLVLFHICDQRVLCTDQPSRFPAKRIWIYRLAVKRFGEVVDDFELRVARVGKLLHVGTAVGIR